MTTASKKFDLIDMKLVSWAQYLHWSDINFNRYVCSDDEDSSYNISIALQWFASEYVVIDGWKEIQHHDTLIDDFVRLNASDIELLRRARNAVYHFQKNPLDDKLMDFSHAYSKNGWLVDLHMAFLNYLRNYPESVYPFKERKDEFIEKFFGIVGWRPEPVSFNVFQASLRRV